MIMNANEEQVLAATEAWLDQLDPALLKQDKARRKKPEPASGVDWQPPERPWDAERFAAEFSTDEPQHKLCIIEAAVSHSHALRRFTPKTTKGRNRRDFSRGTPDRRTRNARDFCVQPEGHR
jgi:hypothetical protein